MTEKYTPQVGDRVRLDYWATGWVDVCYVDDRTVAGYTDGGHFYFKDATEGRWAWVKVDPLPELWCNVYVYNDNSIGGFVHTYDATPAESGFCVHLIPDGDGYRAEVIRP